MHFTWIIFKENITDVGPPLKPNLFFAWIGSMSSIIWNHEVCLYLLKIKKNGKIILKSKKICESVYLKGKIASLLKTR